MVITPRLYFRRVLPALAAVMFACPASARADRVDIHDPAVLGSVLQSNDLNGGANDFERLISEVRYVSGIYSYIFAVQTSPYFPAAFGHSEGEAELVSFAVRGHPLEGTWGVVRNTDPAWCTVGACGPPPFPSRPTNAVRSFTPVFDGFVVVPEGNNSGSFTVVYMRSPFPPSALGAYTYTGRNYCFSYPECFDEDGNRVYDYASYQRDGALVPTPEPGTIILFGSALGFLTAKRRAFSRRLSGRTP
jgi:hypothetical protein